MSRLLTRIHRQELAPEHARLVEQALRVGAGENRRYVAGTGADPERLRRHPRHRALG